MKLAFRFKVAALAALYSDSKIALERGREGDTP